MNYISITFIIATLLMGLFMMSNIEAKSFENNYYGFSEVKGEYIYRFNYIDGSICHFKIIDVKQLQGTYSTSRIIPLTPPCK